MTVDDGIPVTQTVTGVLLRAAFRRLEFDGVLMRHVPARGISFYKLSDVLRLLDLQLPANQRGNDACVRSEALRRLGATKAKARLPLLAALLDIPVERLQQLQCVQRYEARTNRAFSVSEVLAELQQGDA